MPQEKMFLLLETPVRTTVLANFLGRVVASPERPLEEFAPFHSDGRPAHLTSDIIPNILPSPRTATQKNNVMIGNGGGGGATLGAILRVDFTRRGEQQRILDCDEVKTYTLENVKITFQDLMRNPYYKQDVEALLHSRSPHGAHFVTGCITATNAKWLIQDKLKNTQILGATLPIAGFAGVPNLQVVPETLDVGGQAGVSTTSARRSELKVQGEEIIAVSYFSVKVKYGYDFGARVLTRTPVVTRARRTKQSELSMAGEGEDTVAYNSDSDIESLEDENNTVAGHGSDYPFILQPVVANSSDLENSIWL